MRRLPAKLVAPLLLAATCPAAAAEPPEGELVPTPPPFSRLILEDGRTAFDPPDPGGLHFQVHGEYQLRLQGQTTLPLEPPVSAPRATTLGQNDFLYHWLRVTARFDAYDKISLVMQADVPRGMIAGQTTQWVQAARDSFADAVWYEIHPRYLYLEYRSPIGLFLLGQQGSHWGMGIVANDGDHATLFGDHRRGSLVERVAYATTPLGKGTPLFVAVGADLVFQDATADLLSGDRAFQGFAAVGYRTDHAEIGLYGVGRHQERNAQAVDQYTPFVQSLTVGVVDLSGRFDAPVPGAERARVYGELEAAAIFGSTSYVRGAYLNPTDPTATLSSELVRTYGGAATLGAVAIAGEGKDRWGRLAGEVEVGYASGDANPTDGVSRRFTFDENHHVGLVLFDHVLRWKTARSASIARDPALVARPAPGLDWLPSNGGVFGAQYVNPRVVVRPRRWLDLKGGVVIAQTTADFVDPYHFVALGNARNYDGGDPRLHDLGVELDLGAAARIALDPGATLQIGAEGGVLFPGHAFDDAAGKSLPDQMVGVVQVGLQF